MLLVQLLVLAFTGAVWWLARRDLTSRPAPPVPIAQADAHELEQLCVTLAALVTDLTGRMEAMEQRLQEGVGTTLAAPASSVAPSLPTPPAPKEAMPKEAMPMEAGAASSPPTRSFSPLAAAAEPEIAAHAPLFALLDAGITDPAEITRRTGLGRGEVELILSLRARHAL